MSVQLQAFQTDHPTNPLHRVVTAGHEFEEMMRRVQDSRILTFDFETSGTAWFQHARACGLALAVPDESARIHAYYVPFRHDTGETQLDIAAVGPAFKQLLENQYTYKVAHNIKFDAHFARCEGWKVQGPRYDTLVAARMFNENGLVSLKARAKSDLGHTGVDAWEKPLTKYVAKMAKTRKIGIKSYKKMFGYSQVPINMAGTYACWDAHYTMELYWHYEKWGVSRRYERIWPNEMALTEVLGDMEWEGMPLDVGYLENLRDSLGGQKAAIESQVFDLVPKFNMGSDEEIRYFLLNTLRLPLEKKTKNQQYSVDREVLEQFSDRHPSLPLLMDWRDADKLETTYTTSLLGLVDAHNILHTNFKQAGTDTGRLSASEPNLQNQPTDNDKRAVKFSGKKLEDGGTDPWSIRRGFVVKDPKIPRLFFDYSQVELRVMAFYSQDPVMTDAYLKGEDIHTRTSMEVFGTAAKSERRNAKIINFGLSYCMSEMGFARQAKISVDDAKKYLDKFMSRFARIGPFREDLWNTMLMNGCESTNIFGRTRRLPDLASDIFWKQKRAQRQAIGSLIQGTAAELTKESLVRVHRFLKSEFPEVKLVNTVHDEIQLDCPVDCLPSVVRGVKRMMEDFPEFAPIPITVDGDYSVTNWAEKHSMPA